MVLVTGANGFLGSCLVAILAEDSTCCIKAAYRKEIPPHLAHLKNVTWLQADLLDVFDVENILRDVVQVYHCAAIISYDSKEHEEMIRANTAMTANVVNAALDAGVKKLLHVSSIAALGKPKGAEEVTEESHWQEGQKSTAYGMSKYLSEMEVWRGIGEGLNAVIVNPGIILGSGNWQKGSAQLMRIAAKEFPYYAQGITAWVAVADVARAMLLLMNSDVQAERFILSAGNFSFKDVLSRMALALHKKPPYKKVTHWQTGLLWRWEKLKSFFTTKPPTVTRDAATTAQTITYYNAAKFSNRFPSFCYTQLDDTIHTMAEDFTKEDVKY